MTIRPATPEDVPQVLPMVGRVCLFHQQLDPAKYSFIDEPEKRYERWLTARAGDARSVFLVAQREERLAGFLAGTTESEMPIYRVKEYGFIHDVWVEPEYRNEGLGRQMVMLAIERFREMGLRQVRLDCLVSNLAARGLFTACGFRASILEMICEVSDAVPERRSDEGAR